jgi:hypothetical protein
VPGAATVAGRPTLGDVTLICANAADAATMARGVERSALLAAGDARRSAKAARETWPTAAASLRARPARRRRSRTRRVNIAPENQIPSIPCACPGDDQEIQLQRGAMPRALDGTAAPLVPVRSRTMLLREGLDAGQPSFAREEEAPHAGTRLAAACSRTRMPSRRAVVWPGIQRLTGRSAGSSFLD